VALHGLLHRRDELDLRRSFKRRLGGKATLQRWVSEIRAGEDASVDEATRRHQCNRALRNRIERRLGDAGVDADPKLTRRADRKLTRVFNLTCCVCAVGYTR